MATTENSLDRARPTQDADRILSLDVLRGTALLGILLLNIIGMGLPFAHYFNPVADGPISGASLWAWITSELLFEGSFRTLFSMLFGAGILLFTLGPRGKSAGTYYRRTLLLIAFGLFDAFILLWPGDILVVYGLAGLILYFARNWTARRQLTVAAILMALMVGLYSFMQLGVRQLEPLVPALTEQVAAGQALTEQQAAALASWRSLTESIYPTAAETAAVRDAFAGDYADAFTHNAAHMPTVYLQQIPFVQFWDALMMMLIGMALFQLGALQGAWRAQTYKRLAIGGFAVGIGVNGFEVYQVIASGYATPWLSPFFRPTYDLGRLGNALGYLSLVMLFCQSAAWPWLRAALAAVGRMALTNYLMHSLIAMFLFRGFGLGLFEQLSRMELFATVGGIWLLQLFISPLWLRHFQFGPVEWCWRALTYGQLPPFRRR